MEDTQVLLLQDERGFTVCLHRALYLCSVSKFSSLLLTLCLLLSHSPSSRVFSLLLLPWLESLPKLLVDLGQSSPPLSAFVIDSLASAAAHTPLGQLEHNLASIIGMHVCVHT